MKKLMLFALSTVCTLGFANVAEQAAGVVHDCSHGCTHDHEEEQVDGKKKEDKKHQEHTEEKEVVAE